MIVNTLKKCCENCRYIDGYVSTDLHENCIGNFAVVSTIYCDHKEVCKPYIEELQNECEEIMREASNQCIAENANA